MNAFKLLVAICIVNALLACSSSSGEIKNRDVSCFEYGDFEETRKLRGHVMVLDSSLLAPIRLQMYDSLLALLTPKENNVLHIIDPQKNEIVASGVTIGQAPNEVLAPYFVNDCFRMQLSDLMSSGVLAFAVKDKKIEFEKRISLKQRSFGEVHLLDDKYIAPSYADDYLFNIFDSNGNNIGTIGNYPIPNFEVSPIESKTMYGFAYTTNRKDRIAVCYNWTDLIDIYDDKGNLCHSISGPLHFTSLFKERHNGDAVAALSVKGNRWDAFFVPVAVDNDFWVLFSGEKVEDDSNYRESRNQLLVFGWDGTPKKRFILDRGIFAFTVDSKRKNIYAISDIPEIHVVKYEY